MRDRLSKAVLFVACFCLCASASYRTIQAQKRVVRSSVTATSFGGDWRRDKLNGHVRRLRVETAKILVKEGKPVEGPRVLREISSYGPNGVKVDSVAYPAQAVRLVGKPEYQYDGKGNIVEMILRGEDSSILSREVYQYEFDEFENWKKMTTLTTVYENGNIGYEPVEITYRTITYYYGQVAANVPTLPIKPSVSNITSASTGETRVDQAPVKEPTTAAIITPKAVTNEPKKIALSEGPQLPVKASATERGYTPALSSAERQVILGALRISVARELKKPVIFRIGEFKVKNGLAELGATPLQPNLQPFDYRNTPYEKCMASGTCKNHLTAVLQKQGRTWTVVRFVIESTGSVALSGAPPTNVEETRQAELASVPAAAVGVANSDKKKAKNSGGNISTPMPEPVVPAPAAVPTKTESTGPTVKHVSEAALRNAAIQLPQPVYPPEAIAGQLAGTVEVQILVNEKGEVLNARAVSGEPLLAQAAEAAARQARFVRSKLSRTPARIYGVVNYTFTVPDQKVVPAPSATVSSTTRTAATVSAQPPVPTKTETTGPRVITLSEQALRSAAIELPQPEYPQAAISAQAEGIVEVQILINEKGEVLNARAVSDDPLLGAAAEAAARRARFMGAKLSTKPARIYGVINYTFRRPDQKSANAPSVNDHSEPSTATPDTTAPALEKKEEGSDPKQSEAALPSASSLYTMGSSLLAEHRYAEAVDALKQAIQLDPNAANAETYYRLGNAYTSLGKHSEALESLKQALRLMKARPRNSETANIPTSPSLSAVHYVTGLAYYNLRRYSEAITELKQVTALNPKLAQAYYGLALSYIGLGDLKSAEKQRKALASLDPVLAEQLVPFLSTAPQ